MTANTEKRISRKSFSNDVTIICSLFIVVALVYWATIPTNQTEADDSYWYALDVESEPVTRLFHVLHLLFLPSMQVIFLGVRALGLADQAFFVMLAVSLLLGAGTVALMFAVLRDRLSTPWPLALAGSALVAFSYGFWRYSVAVESYIPAMFFSTWLFHIGFRHKPARYDGLLAGAVAAAAISMHGLSFILACLIVPARFLITGHWRVLVSYSLTAATLLVAAYGAAYLSTPIETDVGYSILARAVSADFAVRSVSVLKSIVAFAQTIVSGNFLFASEHVTAYLQTLFPNKMLDEEIFMGRAAPTWWFYASAATVTALVLCGAFLAAARTAVRIPHRRVGDRGIAARWYVLAWFLAYIVVTQIFEGADPEVYVMAAIPAWLTAVAFVLGPLYARAGTVRIVTLVLPATLFLHNLFGGMSYIQSKESDYNRQKAAWLLSNTSSENIIVTLDNKVFSRFLKYYSAATIMNIYARVRPLEGEPGKFDTSKVEKRIDDARAAIGHARGDVYLTSDVLFPPAYICAQSQSACARYRAFAAFLRPLSEPVENGSVIGSVYRLRR